MEKKSLRDLTFEGSASYRICIRGALDERWSDCLGGMRLSRRRLRDQSITTELLGPLFDQAALLGVLNALYDMHFPIISVTYLEQESGGDAAQETRTDKI